MARVFIDTRDLESAVEVRETVLSDDHEIEMVATASEIESRIRGDEEEIALVLTGDPRAEESRRMVSELSARIPRPPVLALANPEGPEERRQLLREADLDECLRVPPDPDEVHVVLAQQLERYRLQLETGIIGRTEPIREVLERIHTIAGVNSTVLLTGESGTGKELVARAIHGLSGRRGKAFIAVNCAALPESLLESELFGHEKGAFTGATSRRQGMFELADGGTILLDEISEMPAPTQTRLLRVLESRQFMRVGGETEITVNVRVVAATNRDLRSAVQRGEFRRDLYYRLNVLHVELPPLRERVEDIPALVRSFIEEFSEAHEREFKGLSADAMRILMEYSWPGNVRELRNLVESMVVLAPGAVIRAEDIPPEIRSGTGRAMLPVHAGGLSPERPGPREGRPEGGTALPEMEFIFRTLVDLKMDVEDLKQEFERYRRAHPELLGSGEEARRPGTAIEIPAREELEAEEVAELAEQLRDELRREEERSGDTARGGGDGAREAAEPRAEPAEVASGEGSEGEAERPVIAFEPGMTMAELEREAIVATLRDVDGNRRRAAEKLQIGERTLYRKLREYDIDL